MFLCRHCLEGLRSVGKDEFSSDTSGEQTRATKNQAELQIPRQNDNLIQHRFDYPAVRKFADRATDELNSSPRRRARSINSKTSLQH